RPRRWCRTAAPARSRPRRPARPAAPARPPPARRSDKATAESALLPLPLAPSFRRAARARTPSRLNATLRLGTPAFQHATRRSPITPVGRQPLYHSAGGQKQINHTFLGEKSRLRKNASRKSLIYGRSNFDAPDP